MLGSSRPETLVTVPPTHHLVHGESQSKRARMEGRMETPLRIDTREQKVRREGQVRETSEGRPG